jgi:hypothetical protein
LPFGRAKSVDGIIRWNRSFSGELIKQSLQNGEDLLIGEFGKFSVTTLPQIG